MRVRVRRTKEVHGNPRMSHFLVCSNRSSVVNCSPHACVLAIEVMNACTSRIFLKLELMLIFSIELVA